ncbi:hypothetical protein WJX72_007540 [[Myrmecia] bisecta]|uniref:Uncharacterized protein n=1 Tax=[Myrmecia] bisecta TaxID=41462 RepID=A0AAW1Q1S0_9CHLO
MQASRPRALQCSPNALCRAARVPASRVRQHTARQSAMRQGAPLARPMLALQGIEPKARAQLLAISLAALERQTATLPDQVSRATATQWQAVTAGLLASCSVAAAQAWLGYTPSALHQQAAAAVARLQASAAADGANLGVISPLAPELLSRQGKAAAAALSTSQQPSPRQQAEMLLASQPQGVRGWGEVQAVAKVQASQSVRSRAPFVLQDMAILIADAVAAIYLAEAGQGLDGGPAAVTRDALLEGSWPTFLHPRLASTRNLERFRNQVALHAWMQRNYQSVVAMYEDRHALWGLAPGGNLVQRSISARRAKELNQLTGWRYTISLLLEAADVLMPLFSALFKRVSAAVSWLLVRLIGRSLGLVYRGVKQSLGGKGSSQQRKGQPVATDDALFAW